MVRRVRVLLRVACREPTWWNEGEGEGDLLGPATGAGDAGAALLAGMVVVGGKAGRSARVLMAG